MLIVEQENNKNVKLEDYNNSNIKTLRDEKNSEHYLYLELKKYI